MLDMGMTMLKETRGRKLLPAKDKRQGVYVKLPLWLKEWLIAHPQSQGVTVEKALIKAHNLKVPKQL